MKRLIQPLFIALGILLSSLTYAKSGLLFTISESGASASADVLLCLNGKGPLSCQQYHVSAQDLVISTTIKRYYPAVGIKILTPGFQPTGCTPYPNGYCLFSVNEQASATIQLSRSTPSTHTVGGTIVGLTGSVSLQNNGADTLTQNSDGNFTFTTPVTEGSPYNVTVSSQPATQTCTVSNGTGVMGNANVTNVQVICSVNTHTVGGSISGLVGSVTLENNGTDPLIRGSNGSFTFSTPIAEGSPYNVTISIQPGTQTCTVTNGSGVMGNTNITNVFIACSTDLATTLSVSTTGTIPVNSGTGSITVTNTGTTFTAHNASVTLPGLWSDVTQDASDCERIAPNGGTCTITFSATAPHIAQAAIPVTASNLSNSPTTALAFSVSGYLVWEVTNATTAQVIDNADLSSSVIWGGNGIAINTTTLVGGATNTTNIVGMLGTGSTYAAELCYQSTNGGSSTNTWYLPAICQLGGAGQGAGCAPGLANIDANLVQLGFGGISFFAYWSSSQRSGSEATSAWVENFAAAGASTQFTVSKTSTLHVRCARSITY